MATRKVFRSTDTIPGPNGYPERTGQTVEVVRPLTPSEHDREEVGPMFRVRFADGVETDAFADELS